MKKRTSVRKTDGHKGTEHRRAKAALRLSEDRFRKVFLASPAAISISWGQNEDEWTAQARTAMDAAFADAAALGVTVTAAAGDDGSTDRATDAQPHCDFPASSPWAIGCGGIHAHRFSPAASRFSMRLA